MSRTKIKIDGTWEDVYAPGEGGEGGPNQLPATGQITSYRTGDDGDVQAGIPLEGRFVDNGDGTITDNATSLMWRKWSYGRDQTTGSGSNGTLTWNQAIDMQGDSHAGYSDWRLPNLLELLTILSYDSGGGAPYTYQDVFPNTQPDYYWSSTTHPNSTNSAMYVGFSNVYVSNSSKGLNRYVRLVRQI